MTTQSGLQSRQQRQALFAQRGHIAAKAAKGLGISHATEATGDLGKLDPSCPGCPPDCFSLFGRKLFGLRPKRSADGGKWLW